MKSISRSTVVKAFAGSAILALALTGCAAPAATPTATPIDYKACMVSDQGGFKDASFNEEAYNGLLQAKTTIGVQTAQVESPEKAAAADFVSGVGAMVTAKCNIIINVGFALAAATGDAAKANPNINFALIDSALSNPDYSPLSLPNVKPLQYDTAQAAFLAGYLAAATTKTGKVATFGGAPYPSVTIFMDGFKQGVDYYNTNKGGSVEVLGAAGTDSSKWSFTGDFSDVSKGKTLSEQFIAQGADIILPVAGPVGDGTGQATLEHPGTYVIGVDSDWYNIAAHAAYKANILTSIEKHMSQAVVDVIQSGVDGTFTGGDANQYVGTLENGGVSIAPVHDVAYPDGIQADLDALQAKIISGEVKVTSIYAK